LQKTRRTEHMVEDANVMLSKLESYSDEILDVIAVGSRFAISPPDTSYYRVTKTVNAKGTITTLISTYTSDVFGRLTVYRVGAVQRSFDEVSVCEGRRDRYELNFYASNGSIVEELYVPPVTVEDIAILLLNENVLRGIAEEVPLLETYLDEVKSVVNSISWEDLVKHGSRKLGEALEDPISAYDPLIVEVPVAGKHLSSIYFLKPYLSENLLGETVLRPEKGILLEVRHLDKTLRFYIPSEVFIRDAVLDTVSSFIVKAGALSELKKTAETVVKANETLLALYGIYSIIAGVDEANDSEEEQES